jgi:hypothetical protein
MAVILLGYCASPLHATDPTGTIRGTVVDQSGAVVPEVRVAITNLGTRAERAVQTDDLGNFLFPLLPVGSYEVRAGKTGFRRYVQTPIEVAVNAEISMKVKLEIGSMTQQVTVTGQPSLVNTRTAEVGYVVDSARVDSLPLNGRNVLQLTLLPGGVLDTGGGLYNQGFVANSAKIFPSASGGRGDSINYIFDGGTDGYRYTNVSNPLPNPDAVQEFTFLTNSFSPEYGSASGGVVNTVSKSGTNELHGSLFEYVRNSDLNAINAFTPGKPDNLRRNQAGFSVGGPVYIPGVYNGKNRTFFFVSWQETWLRQTPYATSATTFTAAEDQGNLTRIATNANKPVLDPLTGQPFPGNIIPLNRFDPVDSKWLPLLPTSDPTTGLLTYRQAETFYDEPQWLARIDHQITPSNHISFRYFYDFYKPTPEVNTVVPALNYGSPYQCCVMFQKSQNATLSGTHVISPKFMATWNITFNRLSSPQFYDTPGPTTMGNAAALGIIGVPSGGENYFSALNTMSMGYSGWFQLINTSDFQYQLSMTRIAGRHELKWGVQYMRSQLNEERLGINFSWNYGSAYTNFTQASFLLGFPSSVTGNGTFDEAVRQNVVNGYFQDNFKVSKRLTVNMGIRFDPYLPWVEEYDNAVTLFRPGLQSLKFPNLPTGAVVAGDPGVPRHGYSSEVNNWAPRLGFAFDPTGKGRMAIRAAAGLFYGQAIDASINQRAQSNFPFTSSVSLNPSINGYGGVENPFGLGTSHATFDPYLISTGVAAGNTAVPFPLKWVSTAANFGLPLTFQWNFSIEKQLGTAWLLRATYLGSSSEHLEMQNKPNSAVYIPGNCQAGQYGLTVAGPCSNSGNTDYRRPYGPTFTGLDEVGSDGNANFNSLVLTLRKTFSGNRWWSRSTIEANYTWSHALDVLSAVVSPGGSTYRDPFNRDLDYASSDFNRPNQLVISGVWSLPALSAYNTAVKSVLGRWNMSTIITLKNGTPFRVTSPIDYAYLGLTDDADQILPNKYLPGGRSRQQEEQEYFNVQAFTYNAVGTFGTSGRNCLIGPGMADVDASLYKEFSLGLGETRRLQLRGDFFNAFNRVNLGNPNAGVGSSSTGKITSAGSPRILQLALKLYF